MLNPLNMSFILAEHCGIFYLSLIDVYPLSTVFNVSPQCPLIYKEPKDNRSWFLTFKAKFALTVSAEFVLDFRAACFSNFTNNEDSLYFCQLNESASENLAPAVPEASNQ